MRDLSAVPNRRTDRLLRWMLVVTLGEAVGFAVPAAVGAGVSAAGWAPANSDRHGVGGLCGRGNAGHAG